MPYNFTHALLGLTAAQQSGGAAAALAASHQAEFLIGTMGPDPYFGDAMPRPLFSPCHKPLGDRMHTLDARVLFGALLPLAAASAAKRAYALGFLCHFLLDTAAHPYIEARFSGAAHSPAEIQMDLMITARLQFEGVPKPPRVFYRTQHLRGLDDLHADLAATLFSVASKGAFSRSYRKWIFVNTLSYDPQNRKLRFFGFWERLFHSEGKLTGFLVSRHSDSGDRLNLTHGVWSAPWNPSALRSESFIDLFAQARDEAAEIMNAACLAMDTGEYAQVLALIGARRMDARPV